MTIPLACLDGDKAPEAIANDLRLVASLPEAARAHFWDALGPALAEPVPDTIEATLDTFSRTYDTHPHILGRALKASRFLVREAGARGLDRSKFEEDVVDLCGGTHSPEAAIVAPILLSHYEGARSALRTTAFRQAVEDHGYILHSIEWRVDSVVASSRGDAGNARIALLTLGYGKGNDEEHLTLHMTPDKLDELRRACERMLRN